MNAVEKKQVLLICNTLSIKEILDLINEEGFTLDEFTNAGLNASKVDSIKKEFEKIDNTKKIESKQDELNKQKAVHLDRILKKQIFAYEIEELIDERAISFEDISNIGVSLKIVNALKYYCSKVKATKSYTIDQLPKMEEGRTDIYFIGLPGSGKSTMIAGLLHVANRTGVLLPDPYNSAGLSFQTDLIQDLNRGVLPARTDLGSYNYIAASFNDSNNQSHPLNIVDVPGELYEKIQDNAEVGKFLEYINNDNKKILVFVIDSLAHHKNESISRFDQSVVFPNILQVFNVNGVLEQTDAIYLVVNKFDAIKELKYALSNKQNGDIALEFLNDEFLNLKNNCINAVDGARNSVKIKVIPFSIGNLSYGSILEIVDRDFPKTLLDQITKDSFIIRGGANKIFS
jgi:hypothetical protein